MIAHDAEQTKVRANFREGSQRRLTLRVREPIFQVGHPVTLELVIPGDARYVRDAEVRAEDGHIITVDAAASWQRIQRREYYRIRTGNIPVEMKRERHLRKPEDEKRKSTLRDISAGGALIETDLAVDVDELVHLKFILPAESVAATAAEVKPEDAVLVETNGRIVRLVPLGRGRRRRVGLRFVALPDATRMQMLRWVYALQGKRRSRELDASFDL